MTKAACILGLGLDNVRFVPVDERLDPFVTSDVTLYLFENKVFEK